MLPFSPPSLFSQLKQCPSIVCQCPLGFLQAIFFRFSPAYTHIHYMPAHRHTSMCAHTHTQHTPIHTQKKLKAGFLIRILPCTKLAQFKL